VVHKEATKANGTTHIQQRGLAPMSSG